jgi:hypothetical protein
MNQPFQMPLSAEEMAVVFAPPPKEAYLSSELQALLDKTNTVAVGWAYDENGVIDWPETEWISQTITKPTEEQYQAMRTLNEIQKQRRHEYPAISDQLDLIFHEGIDVWKAQIQAIKDKYPKPEEL